MASPAQYSLSPILIAGRTVDATRALLPFDVPFRVGQHCFTLRRDKAAEPDWELYAGPAPPAPIATEKPPVAEEEPEDHQTAIGQERRHLEGQIYQAPARGPIRR